MLRISFIGIWILTIKYGGHTIDYVAMVGLIDVVFMSILQFLNFKKYPCGDSHCTCGRALQGWSGRASGRRPYPCRRLRWPLSTSLLLSWTRSSFRGCCPGGTWTPPPREISWKSDRHSYRFALGVYGIKATIRIQEWLPDGIPGSVFSKDRAARVVCRHYEVAPSRLVARPLKHFSKIRTVNRKLDYCLSKENVAE